MAEFKKLWNGQNETNPIVHKSSKIKPIGLWHALHSAAYWGQVNITDFLAKKVDNLLPYTANGWTPMHFASYYNKPKVIEYYLSSNKTIDKNPGLNSNDTFKGRTPLHYACQKGHLKIVQMMLKVLKEKNPGDSYKYTALHSAAFEGQFEVVKALSDVINVTNPHASYYWRYETPLYRAAEAGYLDIVEFLANNSAAIANEKTQSGFFGKTAYEVAVKEGQKSVIQYLSTFRQSKKNDTCVAPKYKKCPDSNECYIPDLKEGKKIEMLYITLMF